MRDYGKVYTAFWSNEDMRAMSEDARMLALYLMTCPHGNMLGCFRLAVPNAECLETESSCREFALPANRVYVIGKKRDAYLARIVDPEDVVPSLVIQRAK